MVLSISFPADLHAELLAHLASTRDEQVSFAFAKKSEPTVLRVSELHNVPEESFEIQSSYHITLTDEVRGQVIRRAWDLESVLIEVHSHSPGYPASFSPTDLMGLEEWVPHVRWRLQGQPYVAIVYAGQTFDALVWTGGEGVQPLGSLLVDGISPQQPTGLTYRHMSDAK